MFKFSRDFLAIGSLFAAFALSSVAPAATVPVVWQQSINFGDFFDWGPSQSPLGSEIGDDFDVVGTITRIDVKGYALTRAPLLMTFMCERRQLLVQATRSKMIATLQVFVTSSNSLIGRLPKQGTKYTGKFFGLTNPVNITVKGSPGGSATAAVVAK
jgi:hypothetical protein